MRFGTSCLATLALLAATVVADSHPKIAMELVADGLGSPIDLIFAPNDDTTRYVVEQHGFVYVLDENNKVHTEDPFMDISSMVEIQSAFDERGLLSVAFHPDFANNQLLYAMYSSAREVEENICYGLDGTIPDSPEGCPYQHHRVISQFQVVNGKVDTASERRVFDLEWPNRSRNGGGMAFGGDGLLYFGLGDAGIIYGPEGRDDSITPVVETLYFGDKMAADLTLYFGKILRINPTPNDPTSPYAIPETNPFASDTVSSQQVDTSTTADPSEFKPEIYAWGVRNPFRISFDYQDGNGGTTFYMSASADTFFESTYKVTKPGNYGWATREGSHCVVRSAPLTPPEFVSCTTDADCPQGPQTTTCDATTGKCTCPTMDATIPSEPLHMPYLEYTNTAATAYPETQELLEADLLEDPKGSASLGGHMYRGSEIPGLQGKFVQADFAVNFLDGLVFVVEEDATTGATTVHDGYTFNAEDPAEKGFLKTLGRDAKGELYAITGDFTPDFSSQIGRIWKIVPAADDDDEMEDDMSAAGRSSYAWFSVAAAAVLGAVMAV